MAGIAFKKISEQRNKVILNGVLSRLIMWFVLLFAFELGVVALLYVLFGEVISWRILLIQAIALGAPLVAAFLVVRLELMQSFGDSKSTLHHQEANSADTSEASTPE